MPWQTPARELADSCKRVGWLLQESRLTLLESRRTPARESPDSCKRVGGLLQESRRTPARESADSCKRVGWLLQESQLTPDLAFLTPNHLAEKIRHFVLFPVDSLQHISQSSPHIIWRRKIYIHLSVGVWDTPKTIAFDANDIGAKIRHSCRQQTRNAIYVKVAGDKSL